MIRVVAFIGAALGTVYAEPGATDLWAGYVLPAMFVLSLAYLFWLQGFVALVLGALSWYYMDLSGGDWFTAGALPLLFGALLVYFLWWLGLSLSAAASERWDRRSDAVHGGARADVE